MRRAMMQTSHISGASEAVTLDGRCNGRGEDWLQAKASHRERQNAGKIEGTKRIPADSTDKSRTVLKIFE